MADTLSSPCLLVINASEGALQLLLARVAGSPPQAGLHLEPLAFQVWQVPGQGAEILAPAVQEMVARLGLRLQDIAYIACVNGPGSFTGLRLALASAAGFARSFGAKLAPLPLLPLLAQQACTRLGLCLAAGWALPRHMWVLTHARRDLVHAQAFVLPLPGSKEAGSWEPVAGIVVDTPLGIAKGIAQAQAPVLLLGSGLTRNRSFWEQAVLPPASVLLPPSYDAPDAQTLLQAAAVAVYTQQDIAPLYVRPCDAEQALDSIARSLQLDPQAAKQRLADLILVKKEDLG